MRDLNDVSTVEIPFFRTPFNYDRSAASSESGLVCEDVSRAKQSFREECDINTIVERFLHTGDLPEGVRVPQYGDFTGISDYQSALHAVQAASEAFMAFPADVRARFGNDPGVFVDFCSDPANLPELRKLGLAVAENLPPQQAEPDGEAASPKDAVGGA